MVTKHELNQFIALSEGKARCKYCKKPMASWWWKRTQGYCYQCSMQGFHILRERICARIFKYLTLLTEILQKEAKK